MNVVLWDFLRITDTLLCSPNNGVIKQQR